MYKEHFGLKEKPFNLVPNPAYLFLSSKHANALTFLEYGLAEKVGFVMLTGEIGIGKTTLVRHLLNQVENDMDVAVIFNTNVMSDDLINMILTEFEIPYEDGIGKAKALEVFYNFLIKRYGQGRNVLLIIDEAQNLSQDVLVEIRMLSNLQTDDDMLLQIMIVGQPELRDKIQDPRLEQFAQRIAVSYHLSAMTQEETCEYIAYRVEKAGGRPDLFLPEAVEIIFKASAGIPRTINLLCDAALVYGFADEKQEIDSAIVDQVIEDKGGIGVFIRDRQILKPDLGGGGRLAVEAPNKSADMLDRITRVENAFTQLKSCYQACYSEMDARAKFCRDEMVAELKNSLCLERERNQALAVKYGRIKERYNLLVRQINKS